LKIWFGESEASLRRLAVKCRALVLCSLAFLVCIASARQDGDDTPFAGALKAFNSGKLEVAAKLADTAEKTNPNKPDIPNLRGAILARQKRYKEAEEQFEAALALDPDFHQAKLNLAELNLLQGKYSEARQLYEELQKADPASELVQFKLVLCALLSGDSNRASTIADIMNFPGLTPAYYYARAAIALKRGSKEEAQKYFENVKKYYSEEQCAYFIRSLTDLELTGSKSSEPAKR
jgi:tetratricopeptide (TPR) repeat protein